MRRRILVGLVAGVLGLAPEAFAWQGSATASVRVPVSNTAKTTAAPQTHVTLDDRMMANIQVESVRGESLGGFLTATGKVQFNDDKTFRVLAPLPGQVLDLHLRVGDVVEKDQRLFSIKSREVAALVTDYIQGQRDLDLAEKTHAMTKDLFDHQAASRIALQQSENELAKAKAAIARAEEALSVVGLDPKKAEEAGALHASIPVLSPAAGTVIERTVTPGQYVSADSTPLLTIADLSSVWVLVDIFERDIHMIRVGEKVQVTAAAYPERHFMASVERINDKVDTESRTLKVRLLVENPRMLLKPEMFISAAVEVGGGASITVPASAVFTEGGKNVIYVQTGERTFERRVITALASGVARLRVARGLRPGDRIVTDGTLLLNQRWKQQQAPDAKRNGGE